MDQKSIEFGLLSDYNLDGQLPACLENTTAKFRKNRSAQKRFRRVGNDPLLLL